MSADLQLHGPPGVSPAGRPVPVRVVLRNDGPEELWIPGIVDGSETGARFPHWLPEVELEGEVVAVPPPAEDPLVGPLRREDFHRLAPGEEFDPGRLATFATFAPRAPGSYVYRLRLSTAADRPEAWLGTFNQDRAVLEWVAQVPRLELSAQVMVMVTG